MHLVVMSPWLLLVVTVSQTLLVFNDLDSFTENVRYIVGCSSGRICLILVFFFFHDEMRTMGLGRKTIEVNSISSHPIKGPHDQHDLPLLMLTLIVWQR